MSKKTQLTNLFYYLTEADGVSIQEDAMGNVRHESEQFGTVQLSSKSSSSKVQLQQQNDCSNSDTDTARTRSLVNGYTNHLSLRENGCNEDGDRNQDGNELEDDNNYETSRNSDVHLEGEMIISSCGSNDNVNGDYDDDDNDDDENYGTDSDVECHGDGSTCFDCCYGDYDYDGEGAHDGGGGGENDNSDHDGDQKDGEYDNGVENGDDHDEDGDIDDGKGAHDDGDNYDISDDNDDDDVDDDDGHNGDVINDGDDDDDDDNADDDDDDDNSDDDDDDDDNGDDDDDDDNGDDDDDDNDDDDGGDDDNDADADDDDENDGDYNDDDNNEHVQQASYLLADSDVSRKTTMGVKSVVKDASSSLPVNNNREDKVIKTENIMSPVGNSNTGNENLRGRLFFVNNANTANVPVTSHLTSVSQGARPKTSSQKLPLSNEAKPDYYRIPSLEVTGIDQNFLARHTTDQSLQYISQPDDSNLLTESTSPISWPVWSLPPPPAPETSDLRQQHPYSREVCPTFVGNQATAPNDGRLWNQLRMDRNYTNFPREEQRPFNHTDSSFARQEEAFNRFRISENPPGATGTRVGNSSNTQAAMSTFFESSWRYPAKNFNGSQTSSSSYGDFAARIEPPSALPKVKSRAPFIVHPSVTTPATEQQSEPSNDSPSSMLQEAPLSPDSSQHGSLAPGSTDDHTLAALERKVADACAVVERVMREREERTKKQREAAQRERERRERREREAREAREREEREMRNRTERETREREAREIREQRENEERETREEEFARERAPVQESPRWQCEHYQRRCSVKFPCCGLFYPCHRCHNVSGACDTDDRKANHATHVKCGSCGHEEEVSGLIFS